MEANPTPLKILLADDQAFSRLFVGKMLRQSLNCTIAEAKDGQEAIDLCQSGHPDLVILDINMPRVDGLQALTSIRALKPETPIVMLTSTSEETIVEECVIRGASYFIRKDVTAAELLAELQKMMQLLPPFNKD